MAPRHTGGVATFDLDSADGTSEQDVVKMVKAAIDGNSLNRVSLEPFTFTNGPGCYYWWLRTVSEELTGDGRASLLMRETMTAKDPADPDCVTLPFNPTCTSEFTFTVTRTAP